VGRLFDLQYQVLANPREKAERFFAQPLATKEQIAHPGTGDIDANRGWAKAGLGYTVQMEFDEDKVAAFRQQNPDCKETLELGNPFDAELGHNKWLPETTLPGFRGFMESWWTDCATLAQGLYRCLEEALHIGKEGEETACYFSRIHSANDCHMTWNFYPAMPVRAFNADGAKRLNAHTDFGTLTLVFQDAVGGLEVHDGRLFRPIVPVPGAVVVNVGDMLEQLSNGRWRSALHRVVAPGQLMQPQREQETETSVVNRYSLVFFATPNRGELITIAPGCETPGKWKPNMSGDWGPLTAYQWIQKRLAVDYF
jgi:isopenicillin N synthase-like dioxygenase